MDGEDTLGREALLQAMTRLDELMQDQWDIFELLTRGEITPAEAKLRAKPIEREVAEIRRALKEFKWEAR